MPSTLLSDKFTQLLYILDDKDPSLRERLTSLRDHCEHFSEQFADFDYNDGSVTVRGNGLRSFVSIVDAFFAKVLNVQRKKSKCGQGMVSKHISNVAEVLVTMAEVTDLCLQRNNSVNNNQEVDESSKEVQSVHARLLSIDATRVRSLSELGPFWLSPSLKTTMYILPKLVCYALHKHHAGLFKPGHTMSTVANYAVSADVHQVRACWSFWETKAARGLNPAINSCSVVRSVYIERSFQKYVLGEDGSVASTDQDLNREKQSISRVKCQLIKDGSTGHEPVDLVLHLHGGGFVSMRPKAHQMYLRRWARRLPGVAFLTVDYSLSPENRYPRALQDILDVYMWLIHSSQEEQFNALGFVVRKLVLQGDSAGGNLSLALCHALKRVQEPLPSSILLIYPYTTPTLSNFSAARVLMAIDPILPTSTFFSFTDAYAPTAFTEKTPSELSPWYRGPKAEERIRRIEKKANSDELFNPLLGSFAEFASIRMTIVVGDCDPLLDDGVDIARKWPSKVTLDIVEGQTHGFLWAIMLSKKAREASDLCTKRLRQLLYDQNN